MFGSGALVMVDTEKIAIPKTTRECALCGLITEENVVVCPEDGSALITRKPDPLLGVTLGGKFEILTLIGSGGMGNVYKAVQKTVERTVAVKVLHNERLQHKDSVLRFQQEAKAASKLTHPNIVGFFDYGLTDENVPYIVMDYVEGVSLDQRIKEATLDLDQFIKIFTQACDALDHAHEKGIIHRDIKPSNLMLVNQEHLKILDFGIAKLLPSDNDSGRVALTVTGEVFGSPQYMSPEQCGGRSLDARSDLYSLGCVMYEALVGKPPVRGETLIDTIYKHTHEQPVPPKTARPGLEIPDQLEAIIMKTLEKEPEMRFPSMSALKHNLEFVPQFAEEEKKFATLPESKRSKAPHTVSQIPTGAIIGTLLTVALLAGGGLIAWQHFSAPAGQLQWLELTEGSHSPRLIEPTRKLRDDLAAQANYHDALQYAMNAVSLSKENDPNTLDEANDIYTEGVIRMRLKDDTARDYFQRARDKYRRLAEVNRKQSKLSENKAINDRVSEINAFLGETPDTEGVADLLNQAQDTLKTDGAQKAEPLFEKVVSLKNGLKKDKMAMLATSLAKVAETAASEGRPEKAETLYEQSIAITTDVYGAQSQELASVQRSLGLFYQKTSRYTAAENTLLEALASANSSLGESNPLSIGILRDLGKLYADMKEFKKSDEMMKLADMLEHKPMTQ